MDGLAADRHILDWDETDVHNWLSSLGYRQYESQIREHKIQGDSLCELDSDGLKSLGITTIGQRLAILKAIYQVKLAQNVPIQEHHYVPPSEAPERVENINVEKLHSIVKDQAQRLRTLEEENRSLSTALKTFVDEFNTIRASSGRPDDQPVIRRQPSFKWAKSPTKDTHIESPHPSPQRVEHDISSYSRNAGPSTLPQPPAEKARTPPPQPDATVSGSLKPSKQESSDNLKSFKVSLEDPTWKVLPAALKKYRINNDNWQSYAMFICYGPSGNRIERCLSYDEKPLLLFQKLKDAKKNPVFMLKHIKDIRSPIAVAQQKHAARKASSVISQESTVTGATHGHQKAPSQSRTTHRPPKLEVQDLSATTPAPSTGLSPQPGWPEASMLSPAADGSRQEEMPASATIHTSHFSNFSTNSTMSASSGSTMVGSSQTGNGRDSTKPNQETTSSAREMPPASSSGVSYAVAIYPYMAEQDDEFDVVVGDTFVILSRARGWWVVQRDPTGSGIVETDIVKQGWVPAGCLLETNVPVASAIAEATAAKSGSSSGSPPGTPVSKTPILPLSIISTSFPGIALMDYKKKGDEELDLVKDDALRVFKRYNHWSYAVKEVGGDRGWVPSWFIGKVSASGAMSGTPTPGAPTPSNIEDGATQVSPMSSAFPPVQSRNTPIVV
ncbi:Protein STE50 [Psilocybe cubensis]|uniref:Protein kinase regulator n=2 Tax=Psilocybe cubensis TaxID=181762 RepID=A0A8H8CIA2_PSICU|nr:Protein STE50 [Psilocybe cubensis]KAH9479495.1 Protein STE50 [Psilocybe cubensis]